MYRCCILLALVASAALGNEITESASDTSREQSQPLDEICLRDKYPSASCRFKCHSKNQKPFCDKDQKKCLCKNSEDDDDDDDDDNFFDDLFSNTDDSPSKVNKKKDSDHYPSDYLTSKKDNHSIKKKLKNNKENDNISSDNNDLAPNSNGHNDDDSLFDDLFSDGDSQPPKKSNKDKKGKKKDLYNTLVSNGDSQTSKTKPAKKDDDDDNLFDDLFLDGDSQPSNNNNKDKKKKKKDSSNILVSNGDSHALKKKPAKKDDDDDSLFDDLFSDGDSQPSKKNNKDKEGQIKDSSNVLVSNGDIHASKKNPAKKDDDDDSLFDDLFSDGDSQPSNKNNEDKKEKIKDSSNSLVLNGDSHASKKKPGKKDDNDGSLFDDLFLGGDSQPSNKNNKEKKEKKKGSSNTLVSNGDSHTLKKKPAKKDDDDDSLFDDLFLDGDSQPSKKNSKDKKEKIKDSSNSLVSNGDSHASKKKPAKKDEDNGSLFDDLFSDVDNQPSKKNNKYKKENEKDPYDGLDSNKDSHASKKTSAKKDGDKDNLFDDLFLDGGSHASNKHTSKNSHASKEKSGIKKNDDDSIWDDLFSDDDDEHHSKKKSALEKHGKESTITKKTSHKVNYPSHDKCGRKKDKPDSWLNDILSVFDDHPSKSNSTHSHKTEKCQAHQDDQPFDQIDTNLKNSKSKKKKDNGSLANELLSLVFDPLSDLDNADNKKDKDSPPTKTHSHKDKNHQKSKSFKKKDDSVVNDLFSVFDGPESNKKSDTKNDGEDIKNSSVDGSDLDKNNKPTKKHKNNTDDDNNDSWESDLISLFEGFFSMLQKITKEDSISNKDKHSSNNKLHNKTDDTGSTINNLFSPFDHPPKSMNEKKTNGKSTVNTSTASDSHSDLCLADRNPSVSCKFKCHDKNLEAYCDKKHNKCLCKPPSGKAMIQNLFDDLFSNDGEDKKASSATATPPKKHFGNSFYKQPESLQQESDKCISDKYPSTACKSKCDMMQMQPYCDKDMRQCLCRLPQDNKSDNMFNDFLSGGDKHASTTPTPLKPFVLPTPTENQPAQDLGELCFFGNTPSATCRYKCKTVNMEPYCDKDLKKCLCKENFKTLDGLDSSLDNSAHTSPELPMASDALKLQKPLGEICFYNKFPSATCRYNCHLKNQTPYCDDVTHVCLCKASHDLIDHPPASGLSALLPPLPFFNFGSPFPPSAPTVDNSDVCLFNDIPSASCLEKCRARNQHAHCDNFLHKCVCKEADKDHDSVFNLASNILGNGNDQSVFNPFKPVESAINSPLGEEDLHVVPPQTEPEEHKPLRIFYFFNPFRKSSSNDHQEPEDKGIPTTGVPPMITKILHDELVRPHWSFQHTMAVVIIALLAVLIFLELYACHKRRLSKNSVDTMFSTVPGKA